MLLLSCPRLLRLPSLLLLNPNISWAWRRPFKFSFLFTPCRLHSHHTLLLSDMALYSSAAFNDLGASLKETEAATASPSLPSNTEITTIDVSPPRGTRDFSPEEMRLRSWLFQNFREVARLFGFEEVDFPILESEALFIRKAGEEITEQIYSFEDKGGRRVALRPEITPSLARLVIQKGKSIALPLKWFTIGQCWRYERMTRGRRREHYQWNMDIIGVPGVMAEAELISSVVTLFKRLGITSSDVGIRVSSRKVLQGALQQCSIPDSLFEKVCVIVDKLEKISRTEMEEELTSIGVPAESIQMLLHILSLKSLPELDAYLVAKDALADLKQLFAFAEKYGYSEWIEFNASVVRGLSYYTGIVFEAFDRDGKLRAICGGGRYDHLLSSLGGEDFPACGFGFGDAVIVELLKEKNLLPNLVPDIEDIVFAIDETLKGVGAMVASVLREKGRTVDLILENKRLKWVFKHAEKINARRLILIGSEEWAQGMVRVKDLTTREECNMKIDDLSR